MYDVLARYYDLLHDELIDDIDFVLALAEECGGYVLELGCGTGRLLLPLVEAGYDVTGVDYEQAMLDRAKRRLEREAENVHQRARLIRMDVHSLLLPGEENCFALAIFSYNTALHFQRRELGSILRRIRHYLLPDGRLFLDLANPYVIESAHYEDFPVLENIFTMPETGETIVQMSQSRLDFANQSLHTQWTFETKKSTAQKADPVAVDIAYWYQFPHQIELLLKESGFRLEQLLGGYDYTAFKEVSERMLVLARPAS